MHCSINAISAGVPTILVSYSQKAVGMAEYVYGSRKWVIPIKEFNSLLLINLVKDMLSEYSFIADYLKYRIPYIQDDARNAGIALAELLN
jgi:polysaccharide pyruvyl transferase WcaK-like protein